MNAKEYLKQYRKITKQLKRIQNEIETLRVCNYCGKFMNEGYIYRDYETFCSDECFINAHGKAIFNNADEDELYWTSWEG